MLDPQGDDNAEIGTVFIALATPMRLLLKNIIWPTRDKVIDSAVIKSLELLKRNF
jgi:nicotinamide-nucleotide amidase